MVSIMSPDSGIKPGSRRGGTGDDTNDTSGDASSSISKEPLDVESAAPHHKQQDHQGQHKYVVLFYKYFTPHIMEYLSLFMNNSLNVNDEHVSNGETCPMSELHQFQKEVCASLNMRGRVLVSSEGINGTLSTQESSGIDDYIRKMESYRLCMESNGIKEQVRLFTNVDWKISTISSECSFKEPFPDLKISIVKEIVSTGGAVTLHDVVQYGAGIHLTPEQFHAVLQQHHHSDNNNEKKKELVLIDVRNTFEHAIGHFKDSIRPPLTTFSSFDAQFCDKFADKLKDKKVLMYCTGGIRCEKASVMLKKRGVKDVSQLSGGIHRYLDRYGASSSASTGNSTICAKDNNLSSFFTGKNFVFDQRVVSHDTKEVVGNCIECQDPYDEISGARLCTVCRDLVLVCPQCVIKLHGQYHCAQHVHLKDCYYTFLDRFSVLELAWQYERLSKERDKVISEKNETTTRQGKKGCGYSKNVRRTLQKQMTKIQTRLQKLKSCESSVDLNAPMKCRTCHESLEDKCDGLCWGFWKSMASSSISSTITGKGMLSPQTVAKDDSDVCIEKILHIEVGDVVKPGPDWNVAKLGTKENKMSGVVMERKQWASSSPGNISDKQELNCVAVRWNHNIIQTISAKDLPPINVCPEYQNNKKAKVGMNDIIAPPEIYRWGVITKDKRRNYDVQKIDCNKK